MRPHPFRLVLRQWIEHRNPDNLRLHVWVNTVGWLSLTTLLSQIPTPVGVPGLGANAGAWFTAFSVLYFAPLDLLTSALVGAMTIAWAHLPFVPWGPAHSWIAGVLVPLLVFTAQGLTALFAHIYYHEHANFLRGEPRAGLQTTHAVIFGPFHFWLQAFLRAGWRPKLRAEFEGAEREAILRRTHVPWSNWAGNVQARPAVVRVPQTIVDLCDIVRESRQEGRRLRVVGAGFNWSGFAATDDVLVFSERLDRLELDLADPERPAIWCEAGVTNRQLNATLRRHGYAVPWNVVLETVTVGGIVAVGTHGSGRETATMGDLALAFDVVTSDGELRRLDESTIGAEGMAAARLALGTFGVVARVRLRIVPRFRVRQVDTFEPVGTAMEGLAERVRRHDALELFWFPHNETVWIRTLDRTDAPATLRGHGFLFSVSNFVQLAILGPVTRTISRWFDHLMPAWLRLATRMLTDGERVLEISASQHYRRWIEMLKCGCVEVAFKCDPDFANVRQAWEDTRALVDEWAARGRYPLTLTVNARFIGESGALLSPAFGPGLTCYIEALCTGRPADWEAFSGELASRWMRAHGALPHWAKEIEQIPGLEAQVRERLGDRLERFLRAREAAGVDPDGCFVNPLLAKMLGLPGADADRERAA